MHSEIGLVWQNPIQRTVSSSKCRSTYDFAQLQYTIQHRTDLQTIIIAQMLTIEGDWSPLSTVYPDLLASWTLCSLHCSTAAFPNYNSNRQRGLDLGTDHLVAITSLFEGPRTSRDLILRNDSHYYVAIIQCLMFAGELDEIPHRSVASTTALSSLTQ